MLPITLRTLTRALAGASATALVLGGCSVSVNSPPDDPSSDPTSIVHDNALTLDLTQRPTREGFGIPEGKNDRAYQRTGPMLRTTVKLPGGSFHTPAFLVQGSSNAAGGAGDEVTTHQPKYFDVFARYDTGAEALTAVRDHAGALGIDPQDLDPLGGDLGTGATVPQSRVVQGLVDDWLSVEVVFTDQEGSEVQVQYEFNVDVYHNPAADKVLQDGVLAIDLRHNPSRESLGFLPTYDTADVNAEFGHRIRADLMTPSGEVGIPTESVSSVSGKGGPQGEDPQGVLPPRATYLSSNGSIDDLRAMLLKQADVLGLGRARIVEAFTGTGRSQVTLQGARTDVYAVTVKIDAQLGQPGKFGGSVSYAFRYR